MTLLILGCLHNKVNAWFEEILEELKEEEYDEEDE